MQRGNDGAMRPAAVILLSESAWLGAVILLSESAWLGAVIPLSESAWLGAVIPLSKSAWLGAVIPLSKSAWLGAWSETAKLTPTMSTASCQRNALTVPPSPVGVL